MNTNALELLQNVLTITKLNYFLPTSSHTSPCMIDNKFRLLLNDSYNYDATLDYLSKIVTPQTLIHAQDQFSLSYLFLFIPENIQEHHDSNYLSIGPFLEESITQEHILHIMTKNELPMVLLNKITEFYKNLPVIDKNMELEQTILQLASVLFQKEYHLHCMSERDYFLLNDENIESSFTTNTDSVFSKIDLQYELENKILDAISNGDYDAAHKEYQKFAQQFSSIQSQVTPADQHYFLITLNAMCRKIAEQSGVLPLYIDELTQKFHALLSKTESSNNFNRLVNEIIHKYCLLVKNHSMNGYSDIIKKIILYIHLHYAEDLNLVFFANMFYMNKSYLSTLFKKETNYTLTDYIHTVRMQKAITLINLSAAPIATIATSCGYNSINYFIRIFKRTYGLSPKQYQKNLIHTMDSSHTTKNMTS